VQRAQQRRTQPLQAPRVRRRRIAQPPPQVLLRNEKVSLVMMTSTFTQLAQHPACRVNGGGLPARQQTLGGDGRQYTGVNCMLSMRRTLSTMVTRHSGGPLA
jgi:hypothetical protein